MNQFDLLYARMNKMARLRMSCVIVKTFDLLVISKKGARDPSGGGGM